MAEIIEYLMWGGAWFYWFNQTENYDWHHENEKTMNLKLEKNETYNNYPLFYMGAFYRER